MPAGSEGGKPLDSSRQPLRSMSAQRANGIGNKTGLNEALLDRLARSSHIPALDAIRGISACMVVLGHTLPIRLGGVAVSIFFVLSGFLITWVLLREAEFTNRISLRDFYVRRALRISPAFYVFRIICILTARLRSAPFSWAEAWSSSFLHGGLLQRATADPP